MKAAGAKMFDVETPQYWATLIVVDGVVSEASPILNWTVGRKWDEVLPWFQQRKFKVYPAR